MSSIRPSSLFNSTTSYNAAEVSFSSTKGGEFHRDATASSSSTHSTARIAGVKAVNKGSSSQQPWSMLSRHANSSREEIPPLRVETAKDRGGNHTPRVSATPKPSQSWSILTRHARDEILPIHLQQLCSDKDRVSSLVSVHSSTYRDVKRMILLDISRQRMNLDTINHLLRLAASLDLRGYIRRFSWGHNNPENPITREQIQNTTMLMKGATVNSNWNSRYIGRVRTNSFQQQSATSSNNNNNLHEPSSFWGGAVATPLNPDGSHSMHMSLRAPRDDPTMAMFTADATNALEAIHEEWSRIELLTNTIRAGKLRGVSGQPLRDVVVVGRGVSVLGLKFVYNALRQNSEAIQASRKGVLDESMSTSWTKRAATAITSNISEACRRMRFVSCADPTLVQQAIEDLNPQSTIIVSVALRENEDTEVATRYLYGWLSRGLKGYKREHITSHHMFLVTGDELLKQVKPESTFLIPNHSRCEAFGTFTAATLLVCITSNYYITKLNCTCLCVSFVSVLLT
jgi:glucose-6-phosphate isomerase